ncbi:MAG: gliding motility-associated C-terminal domain-containing protein [Bacteroidota bacterium]
MKNGLPPFFLLDFSQISTSRIHTYDNLKTSLSYSLLIVLLSLSTLASGASESKVLVDPVADFYVETPICVGANVRVEFTGIADPTAVLSWDLDGGNIIYSSPASGSSPAATELIVVWPTTGNVNISLTVTDSMVTDQLLRSFTIPDTAPTVTERITPVSSCGEFAGAIDVTVSAGGPYAYSWTGPMGFSSTDEDISGLAVGRYELIVTDLTTTCFQWMAYDVPEDGFTGCVDTLYLDISQGVPLDTCIGWAINLPDQINAAGVCDDDPATVLASVSNVNDCVTLNSNNSFTGVDTVCVYHCDNVSIPAYCDTTYLIITVNNCSDFIAVDTAVADNFRCDQETPVCVSVPFGSMITYDIFDNGQPYSGGLTSCDFDTTYLYRYTTVPDTGNAGPYTLDYWSFNGTNYSGTFANMQSLVNIMNLWDPMGNWTLNPSSYSIRGGITSNSYGDIGITQTASGQSGVMMRNSLIGNSGTELMLTGGVHELIIRDPADGCQDTIIFNPDCIDCPTLYSGSTTFDLATCEEQIQLCLAIPFASASDYSITDNGTAVTTLLPGCTPDSALSYNYSAIGGTGPYRLINWEVNGMGMTQTYSTLTELVQGMSDWDASADWTLDVSQQLIFGGDFSNSYTDLQIEDISNLGTTTLLLDTLRSLTADIIIELDTGFHQIIVGNPNGFCVDTLAFTVNCEGCAPLFSDDMMTLEAASCDARAAFCVDIDPGDTGSYTVTDNGNPYSGRFEDCGLGFSNYYYDLTTIPSFDNPGIFNLESWTVDGSNQSVNGLFSFTQLVNLMNTWDPTGNWVLEETRIVGGAESTSYTSITISFNSTQQYVMQRETEQRPVNISVSLDTGFHELIFFNQATSCSDTISVQVDCTPEETCEEILVVDEEFLTLNDCGDTASLCLQLPYDEIGNYSLALNGQPYALGFEPCTRGSSQTTIRLLAGIHQLMITEDATGCQDSVDILVSCANPSTLTAEVAVGSTDTICIATDELPGNLDSMEDFCSNSSGSNVQFDLLSNIYCLAYTGVAEGLDSACIVICDDLGLCDTTYVLVTATEEPMEELPELEDDTDSTFQELASEISVLSNDVLNGAPDTMYISSNPANGTATVNLSGTITYEPNEGYCDTATPDEFSYAICNTYGCDTATVAVFVYCNDVQFYTGFSPNGDGRNDVLFIDGLQNHPNNRLIVFNRWGNQVFSAEGYRNDWDGTMNGAILPDGTYFFLLDNGEGELRSGYIQINR